MEKKVIFILFALIFLSGCTGQGPQITLNNNVITLERYVVGTLNPYSESSTSIEFELQHNGNLAARNVEVSFFDLAAEQFKISNLNCFEGTQKDDRTCFFSEIKPLDTKKVSIVLIVPNVTTKIPLTVSYYVKYDYTGFKQGNIPIIDPEKKPNGPKTKYIESASSVGPVQVDFGPPIGSIEQKDDQTITEYWADKGKPFSMTMAFNGISTSIGKPSPIVIPKNQVKLILDRIAIAPKLQCSFDSSGAAKEDVKVPSTLVCNFQPTDVSQDEMTGIVALNFDYTYEFTKSVTFNVQPLENT